MDSKLNLKLFFLLLTVANCVMSHPVVPIEPGSISKFTISGHFNKVNISVNLFMKESENPDTLEAIIYSPADHPQDGMDKSLKSHLSKILLVKWDDEGSINARYPGGGEYDQLRWWSMRHWMLLNKNFKVSEHIQEKTFDLPIDISLDGNQRKCVANCSVIAEDDEVVEVHQLVNSEFCQTDSELETIGVPHSAFYDLMIVDKLFKKDFSIKERLIKFTTFDDDENVESEARILIKFEGFLSLNEHKEVFQPSARPFQDAKVNPRRFLPFTDGYDLKYAGNAKMKEFDDNFDINFNLYLREAGSNQMYARISDLNITQAYTQHYLGSSTSDIRERLEANLKRPLLVMIQEDGKIEFKYVDEDASSYTIGGRDVFMESLIIDLESLDMMNNEKPTPKVSPFESNFDQFGKNCKLTRSYDKLKSKTRLFVDTLESCKRSSKKSLHRKSERSEYAFKLDVVQTVVDSKIVGQAIEFEWKTLTFNKIYVSGTINTTLEGRVSKEENNALIFNLFGEVMDENFLTSHV